MTSKCLKINDEYWLQRAENVVAKDEEMGIFFKAFLSANCPGSGTESIVGKKKKAIDVCVHFFLFPNCFLP